MSARSIGSRTVMACSDRARVSRPSISRSCRRFTASRFSPRSRTCGGAPGRRSATSRSVRLMASGGAQLVRGVRDEPALAVERPVQPFEHRVERVGKLLDLAVRAGERDPLVQAASGHPAGGFGDPVQKIDPARLALARQYSRCMRENGVPKFPDPDAYGGIALDPEKIGTD